MEDDENIGTQDECACCVREVVPPIITRVTCGVLLSTLEFNASIRDDIPADAAAMYWLKKVHFENRGGTSDWQTDCDGSGTWLRQKTATESGGYYRTVYDPEDSCSDSEECGGTGTLTDQIREDPCGEPPDTALSMDRVENHVMRSTEPIYDYTGTLDGSPISGTLLGTDSFLDQGSFTYPAWSASLTLGSGPVTVMQHLARSGTFAGTGGDPHGNIDEEYDSGYSDPDDFRLEFEFDEFGNLCLQIRFMLFFTPAGGVEAEFEPVVIDWKAGDALTLSRSWAFPEIGNFRLGKVLMRHGKSGPFEKFDIEP